MTETTTKQINHAYALMLDGMRWIKRAEPVMRRVIKAAEHATSFDDYTQTMFLAEFRAAIALIEIVDIEANAIDKAARANKEQI